MRMKSEFIATITLALTSVLAYHDPDLNYHLSQVQKLENCGDAGYSYPVPSVQLSTAGVKVAPAPVIAQSVVSAPATYQYSNAGYSNAGYSNAGYANAGYSAGVAYQAVAPKIAYAAPAAAYQTSSIISQSNYAAASANNEAHGYVTSAGLSAVAGPRRTVTPQATYAQAPIIAKVTAAPLIAKFALSPAKTTYITQNLVSQQATSAAKASLSSYSTAQSGGPIVSQVYAAPSSGYATSPALRVQQAYAPVRYQAPTVAQYHQAAAASASPAAAVSQYATSASNAASSSQYFSPAVAQYTAPAVAQYSAPTAVQYSAPAVTQYAAPAVTQYAAPQVSTVTHYVAPAPAPVAHVAAAPAVQYSGPATYTQYSSPTVQYATGSSAAHYASSGASAAQYSSSGASVQYSAAPAVAHVAPAVAVAAQAPRVAAGPVAVKNVHTEFLENYDAHPRYAYEYSVNDPHTGDIKQQKEERDGEVVKGQYSLVEPDGSVRTVNYVADWETGFHADVRNSKQNQH